jgi:hypothetical protein
MQDKHIKISDVCIKLFGIIFAACSRSLSKLQSDQIFVKNCMWIIEIKM